MTDRYTQIIPDPNAVARCLDPEALKILDSHGTFTISEFLEMIKLSGLDRTSFREELMNMIVKHRQQSNNLESLLEKTIKFIDGDIINENRYTSYEILRKTLFSGSDCNLLQPDGKGWQKGKLKLCFEFIPEETEPVATHETPVETDTSPLDEIRQLSNELVSMTSIEQN